MGLVDFVDGISHTCSYAREQHLLSVGDSLACVHPEVMADDAALGETRCRIEIIVSGSFRLVVDFPHGLFREDERVVDAL